MDPPGVGARSLQECLSLQLARKKKDRPLISLSKNHRHAFDEFSRKHYKKLQDRFNINEEELRFVFDEIAKLNPKPGGLFQKAIKIITLSQTFFNDNRKWEA